jgi:hypothetical protein
VINLSLRVRASAMRKLRILFRPRPPSLPTRDYSLPVSHPKNLSCMKIRSHSEVHSSNSLVNCLHCTVHPSSVS